MGSRINYKEGDKILSWEYLGDAPNDGDQRQAVVRCRCGKIVVQGLRKIRYGNSTSCGCVRKQMVSEKSFKHGRSHTKIFYVWQGMKARCSKPSHKHFANYGGRGISVCDSWVNSFQNFMSDMGERPSEKHTLERVDNDGNYEASNCIWVTRFEQQANTTRNTMIMFEGENVRLLKVAKDHNINPRLLRSRIFKQKWDVDRAIKTPVQHKFNGFKPKSIPHSDTTKQ